MSLGWGYMRGTFLPIHISMRKNSLQTGFKHKDPCRYGDIPTYISLLLSEFGSIFRP